MSQKSISFLDSKKYIFYIIPIFFLGLGIRLYYFPFDVPIVSDGFLSFVYATKTIFDQALPIDYDPTNSGWSNFLSLIFFFFDKSEPIYLMEIQRVSSILFSCLTIIPGYFIFKRFTNVRIALVGALILSVEPRLVLISLEGANFSIFFFLFVLSIALFLKKQKLSIYLSFVCVSLLSLIRYEGILLFFPLLIIFLKNTRKREIVLKIILISLIITSIIIPVSLLRMDATKENCYQILNTEICGKDGILNSFSDRSGSINDKIQGIPDLDDKIYHDNERMMEKFIFHSITNFFKFFGLVLIPVLVFFILLTIISLKQNNLIKKKHDLIILLILTFVMIIPSFYAYGRDILEIRYVLIIIPLAITFSTFGIEHFSNVGKNKKILVVCILFIIILSLMFIEYNKRDSQHDFESFFISQKIIKLTDNTNLFNQDGYIKTALLISNWPNIPNAGDNGKPIENFVKISTNNYSKFEDFLVDSKNTNLRYVVVEDRSKIFKDIIEHEEKYKYLEKVFDSKDLNFENQFKIYKINFEKMRDI
mgnify:CR=1 FL=1